MAFWAVGTNWEEEQLERFINNGIWEDGYYVNGDKANEEVLKKNKKRRFCNL